MNNIRDNAVATSGPAWPTTIDGGEPTIPLTRLQFRHQRLTNLFTNIERQRKPGILDQIQSATSLEAAHVLWHEFLEDATHVSQKTINKATRLLETLEFPLA